ncbi:Protein-serine/threonine phosphatase [Entamoeba marina]
MISFRSLFEAKPKQEQVPLTGNTTLDAALQPLRQSTPQVVVVSPQIITHLNTIVTLPTGEPIRALLRRLTHLQIVADNNAEYGSFDEEIKLSFTTVSPLLRLDINGLNAKYSLNGIVEMLKEVRINNVDAGVAESILFEGNKEWKSLEKLSVNHCNLSNIRSNGFSPIHFPKLNRLDLSHNNISVLENINERPLDCLILDNNSINSIDIHVVGSISYLSLDNNYLESLNAFGVFLQLRYLSIKNNHIADTEHLKEAFNRLFNLVEMRLEGNPLLQTPQSIYSVLTCLPSITFGISCKVDNKVYTTDDILKHKQTPTTPQNVVKIVKREITDSDVEEYIKNKVEEVLSSTTTDGDVFDARNFLDRILALVKPLEDTNGDIDVSSLSLNDLINN